MVITVGRQYGSGGREIGTMLAKQLGIAYYDDMLLKEAAEESGLCEELFRSFDERPKSFLYSIAMDPYSFSMNHVTPKGSIEQQVYLATYDTIKKLADKGPCVLIGRCADYALKDRDDVINLFITAPLENRIKRVAARNGISENEAKDRIKKTDKSRASYYNYYSAKDWGDAKSYDLWHRFEPARHRWHGRAFEGPYPHQGHQVNKNLKKQPYETAAFFRYSRRFNLTKKERSNL